MMLLVRWEVFRVLPAFLFNLLMWLLSVVVLLLSPLHLDQKQKGLRVGGGGGVRGEGASCLGCRFGLVRFGPKPVRTESGLGRVWADPPPVWFKKASFRLAEETATRAASPIFWTETGL